MAEPPKKILIIDDETYACANLATKIEKTQQNVMVQTQTDPLKAIAQINDWQPDIVFLDITMPKLNGFELIEQLSDESKTFHLVFCTAHSDRALEAFDVMAIDYLVKPVDPDRLEKTFAKIQKSSPEDWSAKQEQISSKFLQRIVGKRKDQLYLFDTKDVAFITSEDHETILIIEDHEYFCDPSLQRLEAKLCPKTFVRTHRSYLVNLHQISRFDQKENLIHFTNQTKVAKVSKRLRTGVLNAMKDLGLKNDD